VYEKYEYKSYEFIPFYSGDKYTEYKGQSLDEIRNKIELSDEMTEYFEEWEIKNTTVTPYGEPKAIDCTYFTGRKIVTNQFWYSKSNIMGKESCPFITTQ